MSTQLPTPRAMIFETYTSVLSSSSEQGSPDGDDNDEELEGATLIDNDDNNNSNPDANGTYSLLRCPTRTPSPSCPTCERLTALLHDTQLVNKHLIEGCEETSRFLVSLDTHLTNDNPSNNHITTRVLTASSARLLSRNQELVTELHGSKMALKESEFETKKQSEVVVVLERKMERYAKLNEELVKAHVRIKGEKRAFREALGAEQRKRGDVERELRVLGKEYMVLEDRVRKKARGEVELWWVVGLIGLILWFGWDLWWILVRL